MAVLNVQNWNVEQVVDWLTGLDPSLSQYTNVFSSAGITGEKLLNIMPGDLEYVLRIARIGDQLLIHDAIQTLRDELHTPWTTMQTLSLALSVRCKNYRSELTQQKQRYIETQLREAEQSYSHSHHHSHTLYNNLTAKSNVNKSSHHPNDRGHSDKGSLSSFVSILKLETIPTTSLASASYLLDAGKVLIRWLTRFPFLGKLNYDEISRKLTKHCFELAVLSQRDTFADNAIEEVQYLCTKIIELCETLVHTNDSLAIQPAGIDIITLRKRTEQDWGLHFESSYWGIHQITGVKLSSPAQQSGHLERGDEILQVNYQTVLAWPQSSVISMLHENENEVILTVKRRPRHASTNLLLLGGHQNNMYLNKVPNRKSFFERKAKEQRARERNVRREESVRVLLDEVVIEEDETSAVEKPVTPVEEVVVKVVEVEKENDIVSVKNGTGDVAAQTSGEDEKVAPSDVRFWKLYPKPKYLIKRRATVTGASPTETRPPVTFINDSTTPPPHPSQNPYQVNHHRSDPSSSESPNPCKPHQTVHHRRSTPVSMLTAHDSPVQLLHPPLVQRPPLDKSRSAPEQELIQENVKPTPPLLSTTHHDAAHDTLDDDDVFVTRDTPKSTVPPVQLPNPPVVKQVEVKPIEVVRPPPPVPPTPKPRLSRCSTTATVKLEHDTPPPPSPKPLPPPYPPKPLPPSIPPKILHRGILHIRSQLRKQSSSNSASALPVIGPNCSLSSSTSALLSSSSPRWIRQNAIFYSNRELEIVNPVSGGTRSVSVSNSSSLCGSQNFRVKIAYREGHEKSNGLRRDEFNVFGASEVHSRPFAFKITSGDSVTYYLAAESQMELDQWISVMTTGEIINPPDPRNRTNSSRNSTLSSAGDSGRKNFARAPYKRSISLGSSQSPYISNTNLSTPPHSSTPPPSTTTTPQKTPVTPRFYASSTNLSSTSLPSTSRPPRTSTPCYAPYDSPSRTLLNRSNSSTQKTSSLKTDWFLRNTPPSTSSSSSNISSITITSKKTSKTQVSTQYPTPTGTPTKTNSTSQPMMGVTMKSKKNSTSSSTGGSCTTSPTRKYMCPNCCNVMKIDTGTQTDVDAKDNANTTTTTSTETETEQVTPAGVSGELKLVFFNSGESRV